MSLAPAPEVRPRALLSLAAGVAVALALVFALTSPGDAPTGAAPPAGGGAAAAPTPPTLPDDPPERPAPDVGDGRTIVSFTFDDGKATQVEGARILDAAGMPATFYVVSSWIGRPGYLSHEELIGLRMSGHEIGGHTATHEDLATLPAGEAARQVCTGRQALEDWGYRPVSFSYPFTSSTPAVEEMVRECGYDTGRRLGGTRSPTSCDDCEAAETLPPADPFALAAPDQVDASWTLEDLQARVTEARESGGGWVALTFHDVCDDPGATGCPESTSVRPELLEEFVRWLEEYQEVPGHRTSVATVGDTYRAAVREDRAGYTPARTAPAPSVAPKGTNGVRNPSLETPAATSGEPDCFERGGWGENRASWSTAPGRTGSVAQQLAVTDHTSGDAKLMPRMDLGACSPAVRPGQRYDLGAWYRSTGPTEIAVHYRTREGSWRYWTSGPSAGPRSAWTKATWRTPPLPRDATGLSFGLALTGDGTLVTDDYSVVDAGGS